MDNKKEKYSDQELINLTRNKGKKGHRAFEQLYDKYAPGIYKYCRKILGNEEMAQDALQDTFLRFYKSLQEKKEMGNVRAYLTIIARNICLTLKNNKYNNTLTLDKIEITDTETAYEHKELLEIVKSAIECLPLEYREPFVMREYQMLSYPEIAEILEIPISTVKIRIYRAKQKIHNVVKPYINDLLL